MKIRTVAALVAGALSLWVSAAQAQNYICPTQPPGDNETLCASTAFVQQATGNAISGLTGDVSATGPGNVTATIQSGVVTSVKMAAGAAAGNVGTLSGVLTGTLPSPGLGTAVVGNSNLATTSANTWKGNGTGTSGPPSDNAWTNCNGANSAVTYTNGTGTGCNSSVASLTATGQTLSGGATVTAVNLGTFAGTATINCGSGPEQFGTNNAAFTLAAPAADSSCMVLVTNGATAGAITFSGFSVGTSTGDPLTTTNTNKFTISIWRINGTSGYRVAAHQ